MVTLGAIVPQSDQTLQHLHKKLMADNALTAVAHQALMVIITTPDSDGWRHLSIKDFCLMTRRSRNAVRQAILLLEERGYILIHPKREPGKLRQSHEYLVVANDEARHE